jgi:hypothetical protein
MKTLSPLRRNIAVLGITAASAVGLQAQAPEASAHEPVPTDYCTNSPDSVPGLYNFSHPCAHHDACYELYSDTRYGCDTTFRREMLRACDAKHSSWSPLRAACRGVADTYYASVRLFGVSHYSSRDSTTPMS